MPRNTAASRTPGLAEFVVLLCKDEALEVGVLGLFVERLFVGGNLLGRECSHSLTCEAELVVCGEFVLVVRFLGQVAGIADAPCVERFLFLGEIGVGMLADFTAIVRHHVDGFVLSHVVRAILVSASKHHFEGSYSDALTLRSAKTSFYVPRGGSPPSS